MKYSQAKQGHIFVIRLEDGDIVHKEIERFARNQSIKAAALIIIGGADGMWQKKHLQQPDASAMVLRCASSGY